MVLGFVFSLRLFYIYQKFEGFFIGIMGTFVTFLFNPLPTRKFIQCSWKKFFVAQKNIYFLYISSELILLTEKPMRYPYKFHQNPLKLI